MAESVPIIHQNRDAALSRDHVEIGDEIEGIGLLRQPIFQRHHFGKTVVHDLIKTSVVEQVVSNVQSEVSIPPEQLRHVIKIQAMFRGIRVRREIHASWSDAFHFSGNANFMVIKMIKHTYVGITKLFAHLSFLLIFSLMLHYQLHNHEPNEYAVRKGVISRFIRPQIGTYGVSPDEVNSIKEIFEYIRIVSKDLHSKDPIHRTSDACIAKMQAFCDVVQNGDYESKISFAECFSTTKDTSFVNPHSRGQLSILLTQKRRKTVPCIEKYSASGNNMFNPYEAALEGSDNPRMCFSEEEDLNFTSRYFNVHQDQFDKVYNLGTVPFVKYNPTLKGFVFMMAVGVVNDESFTLDCDVDWMEQVQWIDERTSEVCMKVLTVNKNQEGAYVAAQGCFHISLGGQIEFSSSTSYSNLFRVEDQTSALVLFSIFTIMVTVIAARRLRKSILFVKNIVRSKMALHKIVRMTQFWILLIDYAVLALYIWCIVTYIGLVVHGSQFEQLPVDITVFGSPGRLKAFLEDILLLEEMVYDARIYKNICAMIFLELVIQTMRYLDFHPDLGLVTRTLSKGSKDLGHFGVVFLAILVFFSFIAQLILGEDHLEYSNIGWAMNEMLFVAVGEMESAKDAFFEFSGAEEHSTLNGIFFWSFVFLVSILLINVLLSIIVDSFVRVQMNKKSDKHFSLSVTLQIWMTLVLLDLKRHRFCSRKFETKILEKQESFTKGLLLVPDIEQTTNNSWENNVRELQVFNFNSSLDWLDILCENYRSRPISSYVIRMLLLQVFSSHVTEKIINVLRHHTTQDRQKTLEVRNKIFKRKADDIQLSSFQMVKALYHERSIMHQKH